MKKAMLICSMILLLGSCKKKETPADDLPQGILSTESATVTTNDCSFFSPLDSLNTDEKVKWLRANQVQACLPEYDSCRESVHKITQAAYSQILQDYWGTEEVVTTDVKLGDIEALSKKANYTQFITANFNNGKIVSLTATNNFTDVPTCYSVPLFYSLQRLHGLDSDSILTFAVGKKNGEEVIVFFIKGTSDYYDVSLQPV